MKARLLYDKLYPIQTWHKTQTIIIFPPWRREDDRHISVDGSRSYCGEQVLHSLASKLTSSEMTSCYQQVRNTFFSRRWSTIDRRMSCS